MSFSINKMFSWYNLHINKLFYYGSIATILILVTERLSIVFSYVPQITGIDNNFVYPVIRSLAGQSMYPNPEQYPFVVNPYAPIFFILCKWVALLFKLTADDTISIYRVTRAVALLADALTCLVLFYTLRKIVKLSFKHSLLAVAVFFSVLCLLGYTFNRSDALFLFFYSTAIYFLFGNFSRKPVLQALILAVISIGCIFTKQNGIILLVLIPVWLLLGKKRVSLILFLLFTGILGIGACLYFQYIYTDHNFLNHVVNALRNHITLRWFYVYIFKGLVNSPLFVLLIVAGVISIKAILEEKYREQANIGIIFIIQLLFSAGLSLKWGSSLGYFNESFLLGIVLIGLYISHLSRPGIREMIHAASIYLFPIALVFTIHIFSQLYLFYINGQAARKQQFNQEHLLSIYIKNHIGTTDKYVINMGHPDSDFFKNLLFMQSAAPNMDAVSCCTLPDRTFNYHLLKEGFRNGKIEYIITTGTALPLSIWGMDVSNYKKDTTIGNNSLFKYQAVDTKIPTQ